jgi:O-antigen/teichoic acid export membrane protein
MAERVLPLSSPGLSLKARALSAGLWTLGAYGLGLCLRIGSSLLMTRLLAPEMFGVMAIAAIVTAALLMLSDLGLSQNIVQSRRGEEPAFLDTAWTVQIARGIGLWLIALALSALLWLGIARGMIPADSAYASPELPAVIALSSFALVIAGFEATNAALAERRFDQRRLAYAAILSQLGGLAVMIPVALIGRSVWSLVAGTLASTLVTSALSHLWLRGHRNSLRWDRGALEELLAFGKWVFISSAVTILAMSGDRLMLAGLLDARALGVYSIAALLVTTVDGGVQRLFRSVSLPALSEIARRDRSQLRRVYYRLRLPADLALLFGAGILFMSGDLVVHVLYDSRYADAGDMLRVLSLSLFMSRFGIANQAYLAAGYPRYQAIVNVVRCLALCVLVPALYAAAGVGGAIWGVALHAVATLPFIYRYNARLGLIDWRLELLALVGLPAGLLCGCFVNLLQRSFFT